MDLPIQIRKNLLDMHFSKNLQYLNTTIILLFTYLIGIVIGFITKQIDYLDSQQLYTVSITSIIVITVISNLILRFNGQLKKTAFEIKNLG